jgi:hypothetical protein
MDTHTHTHTSFSPTGRYLAVDLGDFNCTRFNVSLAQDGFVGAALTTSLATAPAVSHFCGVLEGDGVAGVLRDCQKRARGRFRGGAGTLLSVKWVVIAAALLVLLPWLVMSGTACCVAGRVAGGESPADAKASHILQLRTARWSERLRRQSRQEWIGLSPRSLEPEPEQV